MLSSFSKLFSATLLKNWGLSKSCGKSLGLAGNCSAAALQCQASCQQLARAAGQKQLNRWFLEHACKGGSAACCQMVCQLSICSHQPGPLVTSCNNACKMCIMCLSLLEPLMIV